MITRDPNFVVHLDDKDIKTRWVVSPWWGVAAFVAGVAVAASAGR